MLHENNIVDMGDGTVVALNRFALTESVELLCKILDHMANDLSVVTGLSKEEIISDYREINDYNPIREILKEQGKWTGRDESWASIIMKKKLRDREDNANV